MCILDLDLTEHVVKLVHRTNDLLVFLLISASWLIKLHKHDPSLDSKLWIARGNLKRCIANPTVLKIIVWLALKNFFKFCFQRRHNSAEKMLVCIFSTSAIAEQPGEQGNLVSNVDKKPPKLCQWLTELDEWLDKLQIEESQPLFCYNSYRLDSIIFYEFFCWTSGTHCVPNLRWILVSNLATINKSLNAVCPKRTSVTIYRQLFYNRKPIKIRLLIKTCADCHTKKIVNSYFC